MRFRRFFAVILLLAAMSLPVMAVERTASQTEEIPAVTALEDSAGSSAEEEADVFEPGNPIVVVAVLAGSIVLVTVVALIRSRRREGL